MSASADASFRRYFRSADKNSGKSYVIMDAPPEKEDCEPFIRIAKMLRSTGVNVPEIIAQDLTQGFLLLTDLGDQQYLLVSGLEVVGVQQSSASRTASPQSHRGVPACFHGHLGVVASINPRHDNSVRADVEGPLDRH